MRNFWLIVVMFMFATVVSAQEATISEEVLAEQLKKDQASVEGLIALDSDIDKPHTLKHKFYVDAQDKIEPLAQEGKELGYIATQAYQGAGDAGEVLWYFDLVKDVVPTLENITRESTLMHTLAVKHSARYSGWSCGIVVKELKIE